MIGGIFMAFVGLIFGWGASGWPHRYDAPIPQVCRTFDTENLPANHDYCQSWFAEHRRNR